MIAALSAASLHQSPAGCSQPGSLERFMWISTVWSGCWGLQADGEEVQGGQRVEEPAWLQEGMHHVALRTIGLSTCCDRRELPAPHERRPGVGDFPPCQHLSLAIYSGEAVLPTPSPRDFPMSPACRFGLPGSSHVWAN